MAQFLIVTILIQVDTRPPTKESKGTIYRPQTPIILELLHRLFLCLPQDRTEKGQKLDTLRVTTELLARQFADLGDILCHDAGTVSSNKDCLCVLCRKVLSGFRGAGLQDHWGALGAWLADVWAGNAEVFADVVYFADSGWVGIYPAISVEDDGIGAPG